MYTSALNKVKCKYEVSIDTYRAFNVHTEALLDIINLNQDSNSVKQIHYTHMNINIH